MIYFPKNIGILVIFLSAKRTVIEGVSRVHKGLKTLVWGSSQRQDHLPNIESPFGPCNPPQLQLTDENKAFLLRPVIVINGLDMKITITCIKGNIMVHPYAIHA